MDPEFNFQQDITSSFKVYGRIMYSFRGEPEINIQIVDELSEDLEKKLNIFPGSLCWRNVRGEEEIEIRCHNKRRRKRKGESPGLKQCSKENFSPLQEWIQSLTFGRDITSPSRCMEGLCILSAGRQEEIYRWSTSLDEDLEKLNIFPGSLRWRNVWGEEEI
ncbi:hypothetical protein CEXT_78631 [Caerostris extrusa]|uniref:Uncharacterized protein n=1 Tax=Caerostris extrusa TaxID=172846 RepID=A0AAV4MBH5_CAEEX|nr:hypothetical protein CEXT_78631 [Caerostris extrusa]